MKAFCVSFALISSLASVHGCTLESCKSKEFRYCPFFDKSCRGKETLNLQGKTLSGVIPVAFYTLFGTTVQGNAGDGIPPVKLKKVYMQNNALTGHVESLFACSTIEEINLQGNPLSSSQTIAKPSNAIVTLNLESTSQTNLKWLQNKVPNLKTLNLANNRISDLSPLGSMKKLASLNLANNPQLSDISTLTSLTTLTSLDLSGNKKITDLTPLVELKGLTDLKVDAPLQRQARIIASKSSAATKRSQIVSAEIGDIQQVAVTNKASIEKITKLTSTIPELTDKNQKLESRIIVLERKLAQLNQACFASSNAGNRRQLNSDCIEKSKKDEAVAASSATATSILSVATVASAASIFL